MAKILIVDDEKSIVFATRDYLTTCGHDVDAANDLDVAIAMFEQETYDLVIADLRLSGADAEEGLDLLDVVGRRRPSTPFVVLTAYGSPSIEAALLDRGANVIVRKPTPLSELARLASELVRANR